MFQKVNKSRPKLEGLFQYPELADKQKLVEIKTRKSPQENMRKQKRERDQKDEQNKSKDSYINEKRQASKSSDKQVNVSKDSHLKDSIREEKDASNELRQSNMSHISQRKSDMSSHSRSVKDLSSLDYLRYKRDQSRERGEFYDMGGGMYKNYKYEKLKLQRPEFSFLSNKPLDFFGKVLQYNTNKNNTEKAIQTIKRQQDIVNIGLTDMKESKQLKENNVYKEIRQKIQDDIINSQERLYPFEEKLKIKKELAKLEKHIKDKNNISSSMSSVMLTTPNNNSLMQSESSVFPSVQSAKNSNPFNGQTPQGTSPSQTQSKMFSQSAQNIKPMGSEKKWLSPMVRYESVETIKYKPNKNSISKTDLILKNELLQQCQPDSLSQKQYRKLFKGKDKKKLYQASTDNNEDESFENEGICINVINFNKAFKGRGQKMHSLLQTNDKTPHKNKLMGDIVKSLNKKSQNLLIVEEFNRLLQMDRIAQAKKRTRKIKTKMDLKIDETNLENKIATLDHCISQEIFLQETFFFDQYIRHDQELRERLLYGISNQHNGIDFESYLRFYQIFVFQNTPPEVLISFVCKFFILNKESRLAAITLAQFQQTLKEVVNHPSLLNREQCYNDWEKELQQQKQFTYDPNTLLRIKHLEQIFKSFMINPNLILKLLFK